jgi:hypothetical protein
MQVIISAFSAQPREFTDAQNAALDAKSFEAAEASWRAMSHDPYDPEAKPEDVCIHQLSTEVEHCISHYGAMTDLPAETRQHLDAAIQARALISEGLAQGCDRIGFAG